LYKKFFANVGHFKNLAINRKASLEAAKDYIDGSFDAVFLDAGHSFEECREDIRVWKKKATAVLLGHDYCDAWEGVKRAVDEELGGPDEVHGSVWVKYIK
jgi:hypothetical protein